MIIKTITCHDVYNVGASLQAYALCTYLQSEGHDVQIIDYKPEYLSKHHSLSRVDNPRFDKPIIKQAYLLLKLPSRLRAKFGDRKKRFDVFRREYLTLTERTYHSNDELKAQPPVADAVIAGSDQIWNPLFQNGKDPAFFLDFVPGNTKAISYAASFATDVLTEDDREQMTPWLSRLDAIAVREKSGVEVLHTMGFEGRAVCDPVFLLDREAWKRLAVLPEEKDYILVYDFDSNPTVAKIAKALSEQTGKPIVSVFPMFDADELWDDLGPREFLGAIKNAAVVISNSFHATAFSLMFNKEFYVVERREGINARMRDLLSEVGLSERMVADVPPDTLIDWATPRAAVEAMSLGGKRYLQEQLSVENEVTDDAEGICGDPCL